MREMAKGIVTTVGRGVERVHVGARADEEEGEKECGFEGVHSLKERKLSSREKF
jgi:hypothetical protein